MKKSPLFLLLALVGVGCSQSNNLTIVEADGSFTRTLKFTVSKDTSDADGKKYMEAFAEPAGGGWSKSSETKDETRITTYTKKFAASDAVLTDVVMKNQGKTSHKNFISFKPLGQGKYEYYEKYVALNPKNSLKNDKAVKALKVLLRENIAADRLSDAAIESVSNKTFKSLIAKILGPDDHLIGALMLSGSGAERRLKTEFCQSLIKNLNEEAKPAFQADEAAILLKKLVTVMDNDKLVNTKQDGEGPPDTGSIVGISSTIKFPGKVIETNGRIYPITGEVFWDFANASADEADVELRAVIQLN